MITSTLGRMADADKLSVQQLKMAVQHGTVPAYIGIPLIQEKMKQAQQMQVAQSAQAPQQAPIADQIMQQASGIPELPSNLPVQMAQGGITHMAMGGYDPMSMARSLVRDDEEPEDADYLSALGSMDEMPEAPEYQEPKTQDATESTGIEALTPLSSLSVALPFSTSREVKEVTAKEEGRPAETVRKETARVERPAAARDLERMALSEGSKYNLDPSLIKHVMLNETGGLKDKANAVSPAGAIGVMQLMPGTARDMGVKDPYDPVQNIEGGVKYLAKMQRKYDDPKIAAIAYNWGPGNTDRWLAQGGDFSRLPKETQGYIRGLAQGGSVDDTTYYQDPFGVDTTQDMDTSNLSFKDLLPDLRQEVQKGKEYTPGISGTLFGYKTLPPDVGPYTDEALRLRKLHPSKVGGGRGTMPPEAYTPEVQGETNKVTEPKEKSLLDEELHLASLYPPKGVTAQDAENMPPPEEKSVAAPEKDDLREYFNKGIAGLEDQKKINAYMALLSAGLGMMSGTSPHAAANIGAGAQQGVQTYLTGNKDIATQQNALMQGRLGLEKYQSLRDIQKQQAQNLAEYRQDRLANMQADRDRKILEGKERASLGEERLALARTTRLKESLARKEAEAKALALAEEKNAFTPEQHAQIQARAIANLHKRRDYQSEYFQLYGELPMGAQQQTNLSQADADLVNKYLKKP
jgi:hypothetical protein